MNLDSILNVVFFAIGLAIGLLQLYVGQHQFEVQQREKMDELRRILTDIQQRLAIMEEVTSQRTFDVQDKLISLVAGEEAVAEFTEETITKVQSIIANELKKAGVEDSVQRTKALEKKLTDVLEKSATSLVDATNKPVPAAFNLSLRELQVLSLLAKGFDLPGISSTLSISRSHLLNILSIIYRKFNVQTKDELLSSYKTEIEDILRQYPVPQQLHSLMDREKK